jgi:hypothetical protein
MAESLTFESRWDVPDTWQQGRGAWGGLPIRAMVDAVVQNEDEPRDVRSITAQIPEPVLAEEHLIVTKLIRRGSAMSMWQVDIIRMSEGLTVARGQVVTGEDKYLETDPPVDTWGTAVTPRVPELDHVEIAPVGPPFGPVFTQHLEYRPITPLPTTGTEAMVKGWINIPQKTEPGAHWTSAQLLSMVDAWWPSPYTLMKTMRPVATVSFSANLLIDPADIAPVAGERSALLHEGSVSSVQGGFMSELRRLWTPDGRLAVENLQSIMVIK